MCFLCPAAVRAPSSLRSAARSRVSLPLQDPGSAAVHGQHAFRFSPGSTHRSRFSCPVPVFLNPPPSVPSHSCSLQVPHLRHQVPHLRPPSSSATSLLRSPRVYTPSKLLRPLNSARGIALGEVPFSASSPIDATKRLWRSTFPVLRAIWEAECPALASHASWVGFPTGQPWNCYPHKRLFSSRSKYLPSSSQIFRSPS